MMRWYMKKRRAEKAKKSACVEEVKDEVENELEENKKGKTKKVKKFRSGVIAGAGLYI